MTIDARSEMFYSGTWNTITGDVRSAVTIKTGRPDQHSAAVATSCQLRLDEETGKYAPLAPASPLYGLIGHGTPLRTRIGVPQPVLALFEDADSYASTPDDASLDITGDIDIRMELALVTWVPQADFTVLAGKYDPAASQKSWAVRLLSVGKLELAWTTDGTSGTRVVRKSTVAVPADTRAVRVTLDVNNGAAGHDVAFYTSTAIGGSWTQLGATVTTAGTTSIFASTAEVTIGSLRGGAVEFGNDVQFSGEVYAFELRNGIGGSAVANPVFTTMGTEDTTLVDAAGRTWTVHAAATVRDIAVRASTEAVSWTPEWDETALTFRTAVDARGILERIGNDQEPLQSVLRRAYVTNATDVVAYWPCEDGSGATQIASAIPGQQPMMVVGSPGFGGNSDFAASDRLPTVNNSGWTGLVPEYVTADAQAQLRFLLSMPAAGDTGGAGKRLFTCRMTGSARYWDIVYTNSGGGSLQVNVYDAGVGLIKTIGPSDFSVHGNPCRVSLELDQVGADINVSFGVYRLGASSAGYITDTVTGRDFGLAAQVSADWEDLAYTSTAIGHITVQSAITTLFELASQLQAYIGEAAGRRIQRLCAEENIAFEHIGNLDATAAMGPQRPGQLLALINECQAADLGLVYEPRRPALGYRTRGSLYNQDPALTLDMATGAVANPFAPPLDATQIHNDITVARQDGSSVRAVLDTGPGSVASVGRRKDGATINVHADSQLPDQAQWRLHLDTVIEHRIAVLEVEMEHHADLQQAVLQLRPGDLIRLTNPPPGLPPGPIDLLALGWGDTITDQTWRWECNLTPASPYRVLQVETTDYDRLDTAGSVLAVAVDSTATAWKPATTVGPLWTTAAGDLPMPWFIDGEEVTVTALANELITYRAVGTAAHADNASVTPGLPAGHTTDDLLVMFTAIRNTAATPSSSTQGYTKVYADGNVAFWMKVDGGSEVAPTVSFTGGSAGDTTSAQIIALPGKWYDVNNLIVAKAGVLNPSAQNVAYPGLTVPCRDCGILYAGWKQDDYTSVTGPGTEIAEASTTTGNDQSLYWAYQIQTTAANIAPGSFTVTGGATAISKGYVLAIRCDRQAATVTRSINNVVKAHALGASITLPPIALGL